MNELKDLKVVNIDPYDPFGIIHSAMNSTHAPELIDEFFKPSYTYTGEHK